MVVKAEDLSPFYLFLLRSRVAILRVIGKTGFRRENLKQPNQRDSHTLLFPEQNSSWP